MKTRIATASFLVLAVSVGLAQSSPTVTTTTVAQESPLAAPSQVVQQQTYVRQPITLVEAAPLTTSSADEIRSARQRTEVETETKIVEKLEKSRIDDEKRRQEAILGSIAGDKKEEKKEEKEEKVEKKDPQYLVVTPQGAIPATVTPSDTAPNVIAAPVPEVVVEKKPKKTFIGGMLGMVDYDSYDVQTFGSFNGQYGMLLPSNFSVAFDLTYSNSTIQDNYAFYRTLSQWNVGVDARYRLNVFGSTVVPNIGAIMNLTRRSYSEPQNGFSQYNTTSTSSNAIEAGIGLGVDFGVSENLLIGMDYRFMQSLSYRYDNDDLNSPVYRNYASQYGTKPLEDRGYAIWGLSLKYIF